MQDAPCTDPVDRGRHWRGRLRRRAVAAGAAVLGLVLVVVVWYVGSVVVDTPGPAELGAARVPQPSLLLAADGQTLAVFRRAQQEPVSLSRIAPSVTQALIATEDHRFRSHRGVDVWRTLSALVHTLGGDTQGGSTITQQLARNLFPKQVGRERSATRKLKEIVTALRLERIYSKDRILETYLNTVPFLYNVVGIEMAARTYFGKTAAELDTLEAATLVGMLKGTYYYNPVRYPERAQVRRNTVLAQMAAHGMLGAEQVRSLSAAPVKLQFNRPVDDPGTAPHFAAHVRKWLTEWADEHDLDLYSDGLVVETTLDSRLQRVAARSLERESLALQQVADVEWSQPSSPVRSESAAAYAARHARVQPFRHLWSQRPDLLPAFVRESAAYRKLRDEGASDAAALRTLSADKAFVDRLRRDKTRLEAGFVAIDPASGEVKAWVGSRDFALDQFDHVAQAERQPGSTFKPFVYGAALEAGIPLDRVYVDVPVEIPQSDGSVWRPTDMSGFSARPMTMFEGLVLSKNTITVQVMQDVGVPAIVRVARAAGIESSRLDPVPSLALGTSAVTLLEMVNAYATIAAQGEHHKPILVRRIRDRHGKVLAEFARSTSRAIAPAAAQDLIDMMRGVVAQGTGTAIRTRFGIAADVAGKTGTTQLNTDGWFILMHPKLVAGAWIGFNDARIAMRSNYWGQGGHNAVFIVGDFFRDAMKGKLIDAKAKFPPPRRPLPPVLPPPAPDGEFAPIDAALAVERPGISGLPAVVVRRDAEGHVMIGDRAGVERMLRSAEAAQAPSNELALPAPPLAHP